MSIKETLFKSFLICSMVVISSAVALAHSNHDHSQLPYKWEFSKDVKMKIERHIGSSNPNGIVGLSRFEQKKLSSYGIKVGNKFSSSIGGVDALVERTSMGTRIIRAKKFVDAGSEALIPIRAATKISKVSLVKAGHKGHDHRVREIEWTFGSKANSKILKRIYSSTDIALVGLNRFEQDLLKEYEINVGNRFYISISGHKFAAERTTAGVKVESGSTNSDVAKTVRNVSDDNV